jgi:hypothetical protein
MKVFISYSADDIGLVRNMAEKFRAHAEVFFWDDSKQPGQPVWETIFGWIDRADLVLAIISDKAVRRAMMVGQEIGRAKAKGKTIIPLITAGVQDRELGCLQGITYEVIGENNQNALQRIEQRIIQLKLAKVKSDQVGFIIGGCILLLLLSSKE